MALSDKEQLMIMKQVALKAGVDLVKERTNIPADIAEHTKEAKQVAEIFYGWLQEDTGISESDVPSVIEPEPNRTVIKDGTKKAFEPKCPECNSKVWDNRETAQGKQPLWKCGNKDGCDTGKGYPWASWNAEEFVNAELAFNKENKATPVDMDDLIANAPEEDLDPPF